MTASAMFIIAVVLDILAVLVTVVPRVVLAGFAMDFIL